MTDTFIECPLCDNKKTETISTCKYPCKCGDEIEVNEQVCFECGAVFETVDGKIIGNPVSSMDDVFTTILPMSDSVDLSEVRSFFDKVEQQLVGETPNSMSSLTHNCLRCSSICLDDGSGVIRCSTCGFEWEVIES